MIFLLLLATCWGVQFDVPVNEKTCISEEVTAETLVNVAYKVLPGLNMDIEIMVTDPASHIVFRRERADEGFFDFRTTYAVMPSPHHPPSDAGDYRLCFSNMLMRGASAYANMARRIDLKVTTGVDAADYGEIAKSEKLKPIEAELRRMEDIVTSVKKEMLYMRGREARHRDTNESTCARVAYFAIFSIGVLVTTAVSQVWFLRKYFQSKKLI